MSVPQSEPLCYLLRIESNRAADMETRQGATSRHAIDVFVVYAKQFAEFRNFHGTASRFEFFDEVHVPPPKIGLFPLTFLSLHPGCPILLRDGVIAFSYGVFVKAIVDVLAPKG